MSDKEKTTLVPKLRFPEFRTNGAVICKNGNLLFESISNKDHNFDLPVLAITQEHGAIPRDQIGYNVSVSDKSLKSYKAVEVGDFIISLRSFQGGIEYSLFHGICSPAYIILRKKIDIVERYYKYYFKTSKFIQDLNKDLEGIRDGKMVSYSQFSSIWLPKPDNKEQQKIADCLSSLDDLIAAEDKKLSTLREHKKGLMQKLFPAEGKTLPEWRFPEFRDCGEWVKRSLGEVGQFIRGFSYSAKDVTEDNTKLLIIRSNNIIPMGKTDYNNSLQFVNKNCKEDQKLILGDITICMANGSSALVGKASFYDGKYDGDITVGAFCGIFRSSLPIVRYLFQSDLYKKMLQFILQGGDGAIANLKSDDVLNLLFSIPSLPEQQKIADCLSALDALITAQAEKIEALKVHKKGLMQGLFPSIEEVGE